MPKKMHKQTERRAKRFVVLHTKNYNNEMQMQWEYKKKTKKMKT